MSTYTLHGRQIEDPYAWLEDLDSPETQAWVADQNRRSGAFFRTATERDAIRQRLTELWNYEKCSVPTKAGTRCFFTRNDGLQNQSTLYTVARPGGVPQMLLDPNKLSSDGTVAMTTMKPSH